ncbi:MAG: FAD-binding oxidoreductase [Paracoccaceae bacterium]
MIDFLVIGGGIAGVSAGARLSHHGSVVVLEAEDALGYHASGRSAAMFEETYGLPTTVALNRASKDYHASENGGVLRPRGMMLLGRAASAEAFSRDLVDMAMEEIGFDQAQAMVPILKRGAVSRVGYHAEAWDIDTDLLIQNFAREIRANGGRIDTRAKVTQIVRTARDWQVSAGGQVHAARVLVNAAGAWADQVGRMAGVAPLGLQPCRRSMARIPAPGGHDVSGWPMLFGPGETWYAKPDAGSLLVSPAEEDPVAPQDAYADDMVLAEGLARYEANVTEPVTRLQTSWAGLRTFAPDRQLVIGKDGGEDAFFWCAGQGGYGFQTAPAASRLLAEAVTGTPSGLPRALGDALRPERFS